MQLSLRHAKLGGFLRPYYISTTFRSGQRIGLHRLYATQYEARYAAMTFARTVATLALLFALGVSSAPTVKDDRQSVDGPKAEPRVSFLS